MTPTDQTDSAPWTRMARVRDLTPGDFVTVWDEYGEVVKVIEHPANVGGGGYYTLHVLFKDERTRTVVGPMPGGRELVCWS